MADPKDDDDAEQIKLLDGCKTYYRLTRAGAYAQEYGTVHIINALASELVQLVAEAPGDVSHEEWLAMLDGLLGAIRHDVLEARGAFLAELAATPPQRRTH